MKTNKRGGVGGGGEGADGGEGLGVEERRGEERRRGKGRESLEIGRASGRERV